MDSRTLSENARGNSVTRDVLDTEIMSFLVGSEIPHYIFDVNGSISVGGSKKVTSDMFKEAIARSQIIFTNFGILLIQRLKNETTKDRILYSDVDEVRIKTPKSKFHIPINYGEVKITCGHISFSGKTERGTQADELNSAEDFAQKKILEDIELPEEISAGTTNSLKARAKISSVNVVKSYGIGIDKGNYNLEISEDSLKFIQSIPLVEDTIVEINPEEIDFDNISMSSKRDFKKENFGRYVNQINPLLDDASPAAKKHDEIMKIPLTDGGQYITITPGRNVSINELLDGLSGIDPRLEPASDDDKSGSDAKGSTALDVLKKRLAKGEITPSEFEERRELLNDED